MIERENHVGDKDEAASLQVFSLPDLYIHRSSLEAFKKIAI